MSPLLAWVAASPAPQAAEVDPPGDGRDLDRQPSDSTVQMGSLPLDTFHLAVGRQAERAVERKLHVAGA